MPDTATLAQLAQAIQTLKSRIDASLSPTDKMALRNQIASGQIKDVEELRAFVHRAEERHRVQEQSREGSRKIQEEMRKDEEGKDPAEKEEAKPGEQGKKQAGKKKGEEEEEEDHAKLTGKVIDAKTRRPVAYCNVVIKGTSYNNQTESSGTFIFEELPKGQTINIELHKREYKNGFLQYKAGKEDEQMVVVKLVPIEDKSKAKKKSQSGHF